VRILFDENVPYPLKRLLVGYDITTVQEAGLSGIKNGDLLRKANAAFDVLILADKNLRYQQDMRERKVAIIELPTNRWPIVKGLQGQIVIALDSIGPGDYVKIEA